MVVAAFAFSNPAGTNFGPGDPSAFLNVTYTNKMDNGLTLILKPINCSVTVPHTEITCMTALGGGKDYVWSIVLDGLQSQQPTTSYAQPNIDSITYWGTTTPVTAANVLGGDEIAINGEGYVTDVVG